MNKNLIDIEDVIDDVTIIDDENIIDDYEDIPDGLEPDLIGDENYDPEDVNEYLINKVEQEELINSSRNDIDF